MYVNTVHVITFFDCSLYSYAREQLYDDITFKYPRFTNLRALSKSENSPAGLWPNQSF